MIHLIAAIDLNRGLGNNNELLIKLPNDMKHFRQLTTGQFCVFGRKTYESIGKPLPNRQNVIVTRDVNYDVPNAFVYNSLEDVIFEYQSYNDNGNELFICGGADIYQQALPYADKIHLTIIDHVFENTDTFFPQINLKYWKPVKNIKNTKDEQHPHDFYFVTYEPRFKTK